MVGEVQLADDVRNLPVALALVAGTDDGYQRSENHGKDDGKEGDDEGIAQALEHILIAVVVNKA